MRILIIGGSKFLGRHLMEAALARGHDVHAFNRGKTNPQFAAKNTIKGDRENQEALEMLRDMNWDAVIDTCGYVPRVVKLATETLKDHAASYVFISSMSVYPGFEPGTKEDSPVETLPAPESEDVTKYYGALKGLCEREVVNSFPKQNIIVRAGFLTGPHDNVYRLPYWIERLMEGGDVLAPGRSTAPFQYIDARDLSDWVMNCLERSVFGTFNLTGPVITFGKLLATIQQTVDIASKLHWVPDAFLIKQGIAPDEIPYWIPKDYQGFCQRSIAKALDAGLEFRPLEKTIEDAASWLTREGFDFDKVLNNKPQFSRSKEQSLLQLFLKGP